MKTLENNKLIAEFMGHEIHNRGFITEGGNVYSFDKNEIAPYCGYDTDWNELMPVVDKINKLDNPCDPSDSTLSTMRSNLRGYVGYVDIESSLEMIVKIITWYNGFKENNTPNLK